MGILKLAIAIPTCKKHLERELAIRCTWGKNSFIPVYFYDEEPSDYPHLPEKVIWMFAQLMDYDFVFKTDTDTYVSIPRLLSSGFEKHDYSGFTREEWNPTYCYGPGYWVSKKAIQILATEDWQRFNHPTYPDCEDVMVGMVLAAHGIIAHHDDRYSHFTPVLKENDRIIQHLSSRRQFKIDDIYEAHRNYGG